LKKIVIDASVVLKWFLYDEVYGDKALGLLTRFVSGDLEIMAPSLMSYEVINGLMNAQRRGRISEDKIQTALSGFVNLDIALIEISRFHAKLVHFCKTFNRSAYDASYLAVAENEGVPFVTADEGLYNSVKKKLTWVKWIGDI
jgi:predicted nucleic acid-binding protein